MSRSTRLCGSQEGGRDRQHPTCALISSRRGPPPTTTGGVSERERAGAPITGGRCVTVIDWLLDSDPSIRWQVMRDLTDAPADEVAAERARVATEGAGARLLALQAADGRWGGAAWNRGWDSTMHVLWLLRRPGSRSRRAREARRAVGLVRDHVTWQGCGPPECDAQPLLRRRGGAVHQRAGRRRPAPTSARTSAASSTGCSASSWPTAAGTARRRTARRGRRSTPPSACWRRCSSTSGRAGGSPEVTAARLRGQEYLLERRLFRGGRPAR